MEAGLVAFQNEEHFYRLMVEQKKGKHYISFSYPDGQKRMTTPTRKELEGYQAGNFIYLKIKAQDRLLECFYSLDNKSWESFGTGDATRLSTAVAGGFVGAMVGLYAHAESPASALFDWAAYRELK